MPLSLAEAQTLIQAAHEHATAESLRVTVAVVDEGGHLIALGRMDGAPAISPQIAESKAVGAAVWHRDGDSLAQVQEERAAFFGQVDKMVRMPMIPGQGRCRLAPARQVQPDHRGPAAAEGAQAAQPQLERRPADATQQRDYARQRLALDAAQEAQRQVHPCRGHPAEARRERAAAFQVALQLGDDGARRGQGDEGPGRGPREIARFRGVTRHPKRRYSKRCATPSSAWRWAALPCWWGWSGCWARSTPAAPERRSAPPTRPPAGRSTPRSRWA